MSVPIGPWQVIRYSPARASSKLKVVRPLLCEARQMSKSGFSRREFLEIGAAAAGGSLAARTVLLGQETESRSPRPAAASDTVRFGMIGVGMEGSGLLATSIQIPGVECAGAADLYD